MQTLQACVFVAEQDVTMSVTKVANSAGVSRNGYKSFVRVHTESERPDCGCAAVGSSVKSADIDPLISIEGKASAFLTCMCVRIPAGILRAIDLPIPDGANLCV